MPQTFGFLKGDLSGKGGLASSSMDLVFGMKSQFVFEVVMWFGSVARFHVASGQTLASFVEL
jgi:hypothetical protein